MHAAENREKRITANVSLRRKLLSEDLSILIGMAEID